MIHLTIFNKEYILKDLPRKTVYWNIFRHYYRYLERDDITSVVSLFLPDTTPRSGPIVGFRSDFRLVSSADICFPFPSRGVCQLLCWRIVHATFHFQLFSREAVLLFCLWHRKYLSFLSQFVQCSLAFSVFCTYLFTFSNFVSLNICIC